MPAIIKGERIGILSDTHGSLPAWESVLRLFGNVCAIFHAGDVLYHGPRNAIPRGYEPAELAVSVKSYTGPLYISRGNCDAAVDMKVTDREMPSYISALWNNKKILMMHGDNFPLFRQMALDNNVDLAISGHTHVASLVREKNTIFLNPGSTTIPRGKDPASAAVADDVSVTIFSLKGDILHSEKW